MRKFRDLVPVTAVVSLAAGVAVIGSQVASGQPSVVETVFVPVTPCRLVDTRPSPDVNTGPRNSPIGADEVVLFNAHDGRDADSTCEIPASALAVATNTVAVSPTAGSFLTLYPADVSNPGTSNLNFVAGQAPTPNATNVPLSADGGFNVFNAFGAVNVIIDINGYYQPSTSIGSDGPAGPQGAIGETGPAGPQGDPATDDQTLDLTDDSLSISGGNAVDLSGYITTETDPTVGSQTLDQVARWDGSQLVAGSITDDGTDVGIGTSAPTAPFDVFTDRIVGPGTLDVSQTSSNASAGSRDQWQSFTAGADGALTRLDLGIGSPLSGASSPVTVTIYAGEGTTGALLATQETTLTGNTPNPVSVVAFAAPATLTSGQVYTYRFVVPNVEVSFVSIDDGNPYTDGRASSFADWDFEFDTFVAPISNERSLFVDDGTVNVGVLMNLTPQANAPLDPTAGDIYFDDNTNTLRYFNGTVWVSL